MIHSLNTEFARQFVCVKSSASPHQPTTFFDDDARRSATFLAGVLPTVQMLEVLDLRYNAVDDAGGVRS